MVEFLIILKMNSLHLILNKILNEVIVNILFLILRLTDVSARSTEVPAYIKHCVLGQGCYQKLMETPGKQIL